LEDTLGGSPSSSSSKNSISSEPADSDNKALSAALETVWSYYLTKIGRNPNTYTLTAKRKRKGLARFHECMKRTDGDVDGAVGLMNLCVDALAASDWHMGRDSKTNGKRYCEWEHHLFSDYEQMEKWWNE
jgi:hypothetical protein